MLVRPIYTNDNNVSRKSTPIGTIKPKFGISLREAGNHDIEDIVAPQETIVSYSCSSSPKSIHLASSIAREICEVLKF